MEQLNRLYTQVEYEIKGRENDIEGWQENLLEEKDEYYSERISENQEKIEILEILQNELLKIM